MANQEHLNLLKQGVAKWNEWCQQNQTIQPDLSETDLHDTDLREYNLSGANLVGTNLNWANLRHADLKHADLNFARLNHADLNFARLSYARLSHADLSYADLSHARTLETVFANLDLQHTKGLLDLVHNGPSLISLHTVQLPQDGSALHFLRGAGVPDEWIDDYRTRMMHPIQYHSLFISYSSKDDTLARRLHADLQDQGVRCWFASEDMKIGDEIRSRIDEAIHLQEKLLLLLSEHSLASTWVKNEVEAAFEKEEKQQRLVLFPVRLDESVEQTTKSWAATLRRTRHIGDFTNWTNPQAYQIAFDRLLRDLKKADEPQDQEVKQ
jgi:TIR domain/Pentapeptide repeats (8 copies)